MLALLDALLLVVGWEGWIKTGKKSRNTNSQSQNSHRDVKYSTGQTVSDTVVTVW